MSNVLPMTEKKDFIMVLKDRLSDMKLSNKPSLNYTHTVLCKSSTSDIAVETWNILVDNQAGRKFKAYISIKMKYRSGNTQEVQLPSVLWDTQKEFMEFMMRECDK